MQSSFRKSARANAGSKPPYDPYTREIWPGATLQRVGQRDVSSDKNGTPLLRDLTAKRDSAPRSDVSQITGNAYGRLNTNDSASHSTTPPLHLPDTPIHSFTPAHTPILLRHRPAVHLSARPPEPW